MLIETTKVNGALRTKAVRETIQNDIKTDNKSLNRLSIQDTVFDNEDSIADNAKMISLLTTLTSRIYDILDDTQKDKLSTDDRNLIEYTFSKFKSTNTRADKQMIVEGTGLIDKLMNRQAAIANLIK